MSMSLLAEANTMVGMLEIRLNACAPKTSNGSLGKGTRLPNRKVDKKVANLLLKVAQKVATLKNKFKTSLKHV